MIVQLAALATLVQAPPDDGVEALSRAAERCDQTAVKRGWTDEVTRHSAFLLTAFREQEAIAADRVALAERRRALRALPPGTRHPSGADTEATLTQQSQALFDRQQALDDRRTLDRLQQEAANHFRQLYVSQCGGRER